MFKEVKSNPDFPKLENRILKNWEKNKSHFKGWYIADDMAICSKLTEDK